MKESRQDKQHAWTAWRDESGFLAANDVGGNHAKSIRLNSAQELRGFISFLKSVGFAELASFDDNAWHYTHDDKQHPEEDLSICITEDQIARWDEFDSYACWSGDPGWDNNE
ncbi:hypothetical protein [Synechococcus sp. MW101C3]|uniref:hypothetical protein n=1 Tax=Synechococcus sp. MW101C3 TaxID=210768 RepID=UPI00118197D0|nr:hypothetical protein [Synechococcus sp. MW101C3]